MFPIRCVAPGLAGLLTATAALAGTGPVVVDCRPGVPTICLLPDPDAPEVLVALTLPVGAADEGAGQEGLAHYVEHLTFRSRTVPQGTGIDAYGNAYTGHWTTTYHWTVPPARAAEAAARAMAVLSPLDVTPIEAAQEREIVAREREEAMDGPAARDRLERDRTLFAGTPRAREIIGSAEAVAALTPEAARAFHDARYDPAAAVLVVAGDVGWDALNGIGAGGDPAPRRVPALDLSSADPVYLTRYDTVQRPERWSVALSASAPDALAPVGIVDAWLTSSLPGAPSPALVRGRDDLRDVGARLYEVVPGVVALDVWLAARPGAAPEALDAPWAAATDLLDGLVRDGLDAATVARLRDRMVRDMTRERADGIGAAWSLIGWLESGATVEDWTAWPDRLAAVTPEDVASVLRATQTPLRAVTLDTLPQRADGATLEPAL